MVATAASPFNEINDVDMATANGLNQALAHVAREKESMVRPTDRHSTMVVGRGNIRTARQRDCHASRSSSTPNQRLNSLVRAAWILHHRSSF